MSIAYLHVTGWFYNLYDRVRTKISDFFRNVQVAYYVIDYVRSWFKDQTYGIFEHYYDGEFYNSYNMAVSMERIYEYVYHNKINLSKLVMFIRVYQKLSNLKYGGKPPILRYDTETKRFELYG